MRRSPVLNVALLAAGFALVAAPDLAAAEVTKQLKAEMAVAPSASFAVENLAGVMHVVQGSGSSVVVSATVHGESDEVASLVHLEQVQSDKGVPTLRVQYPIDCYGTIRYPARHDGDTPSWLKWFGGEGSTLKYGGQKVRVSGGSGVLLYTDVEVQLPARSGDGLLKNHVGVLQAKSVEGTFRFDTDSGDIALEKVHGTVKADTGSGDVNAVDSGGTLSCDTGSGDCTIERFSGDRLDCDVGSGDVTIRSGDIRRIDVDTGSGDVMVKDVDTEEFTSDCGSGDILFESSSARLSRITTDSGSGDVVLRLGPDASFEARADQGSRDLVNHYADSQPIAHGREVIGYKRGDGRTQIRVETGSGDLVIEPGGAKASR